jgi:L-cystine uptake protein TcyP (sodium:dicarboxylate symporter family)
MGFKDIFKDENDINEKSVVGFLSFAVMVAIALIDTITGWLGRDLLINEYIYNSFVIVTLGSFGIAGIEKFANSKK